MESYYGMAHCRDDFIFYFYFGSYFIFSVWGFGQTAQNSNFKLGNFYNKKVDQMGGEIEYFYIEEVKARKESPFYFHFKLNDIKKEYKVETSEFDKSYLEIYSAIIDYSKGHKIIELAHSIG